MGAGGRSAHARGRLTRDPAADVRAVAAAFAAGICAVLSLPTLPPLWWFLLPLGACLLQWPGRVLLLTAVIGAGWCTWVSHQALEQRLPAARDGTIVTFTGRIEGLPERGDFRTRFEFVTQSSPRHLRISWYGDPPTLTPGDCWRLTIKLSAPHGSLNPGGFDYEGWLWRNRIGATGYVRDAEPCGAGHWTIDRLRLRWSAAIRDALNGMEGAAIVRALTVGDTRGLTDAHWQVLRRTGTAHMISISGLHIGLIAALVFFGLRWLVPRVPGGARVSALSVAAVGAALAATGYAALAGFELATQRSLVMTGVVLGAVLLRRRTSSSRLLALAALAVLALDPFAVMAPGFWLSFVAVAWILFLVAARVGDSRWRVLLWLQPGLVLGLMPLTLFWFSEASLIAPLANAVLIPACAVVVPAVLVGALLTLLIPVVGVPLLTGVTMVVGWGWSALEWLAQWEFTYFGLTLPGLFALLCALAGIALLLTPRGVPARWLGVLGFLPLLLPAPAPQPGGFWLTVLDVGQGLSAVVRTSNHTLLFDAGPRYRTGFDAGAALVVPFLRARGIHRLDKAIISHGDIDHRGGWPAVRKAVEVGAALGWGTDQPCRAGQHWRWDGVSFRIIHPSPGDWSENNASCVLYVTGPGGSALLTGDIERAAEESLVSRFPDLRADVLVVPHHGSDSSSSAAFVQMVDPAYAVVPAGWHNRWGFPDPAVVARYRAVGARLLKTGRLGAIRFEFDPQTGVSQPHAWRREVQRIWHLPRP